MTAVMEKKKKPYHRPPIQGRRPELPLSGASWKVAYADFVTAMMAFFLLMWVIGIVPKDSLKVLETYFQDENRPHSGTQDNAGSFTSSVRLAKLTDDQKNRVTIVNQLKQIVQEDPELAKSSGISSDDVGVLLRVGSDAVFEHGSAVVTAKAAKVIEAIKKIMKEYNLYLIIRGHADSSEGSPGPYPSPWELSGARAAAAARRVLEGGEIMPSRVRAVGYSDTRPLLPPTSPENRAANRRVEFYFHRPEVMSYQVVY